MHKPQFAYQIRGLEFADASALTHIDSQSYMKNNAGAEPYFEARGHTEQPGHIQTYSTSSASYRLCALSFSLSHSLSHALVSACASMCGEGKSKHRMSLLPHSLILFLSFTSPLSLALLPHSPDLHDVHVPAACNCRLLMNVTNDINYQCRQREKERETRACRAIKCSVSRERENKESGEESGRRCKKCGRERI